MAATDQPYEVEDGPWVGMIDSLSPPARQKGFYQMGLNVRPVDTSLGTSLVGRSGTASFGAAGAGACQGYYDFVSRAGVQYTIMVLAGEIYTYDWLGGGVGTGTWNIQITAADLAAKAITLNTTARVQMMTYTNKVVFNDGSGNVAFAWDGSPGGGIGTGLTKMTNAPPFTPGGLAELAYNGRLLGIKYADPTTFVWSETDTLNTGYEAGGFNNAWTFVQTDQHRLYKLVASNDGIYVVRARGISEVTGAVTQQWSGFGTRDGISDEFGSISPFSVFLHGEAIFFVDADGQPQFFQTGATMPKPVWRGFRENLSPTRFAWSTQWPHIEAIYYAPASLIFVLMPTVLIADDLGQVVQGTMSDIYVFDAREGMVPVPVSLWRSGFNKTTAMGLVNNPNTGRQVFIYGNDTGLTRYLDDPITENASASGPLLTDFVPGFGAQAIDSHVITQALGDEIKQEKVWDRVDVTVATQHADTSVNITALGPNNEQQAATITVPGRNNYTFHDVVNTGAEGHADLGIDITSRYIRVKVRMLGSFLVNKIRVSGSYSGTDPAAP